MVQCCCGSHAMSSCFVVVADVVADDDSVNSPSHGGCFSAAQRDLRWKRLSTGRPWFHYALMLLLGRGRMMELASRLDMVSRGPKSSNYVALWCIRLFRDARTHLLARLAPGRLLRSYFSRRVSFSKTQFSIQIVSDVHILSPSPRRGYSAALSTTLSSSFHKRSTSSLARFERFLLRSSVRAQF